MECSDLTGEKFGMWNVISRAGSTSRGASTWNCVCECGRTAVLIGSNLRTGRTYGCRSCRHPKTFKYARAYTMKERKKAPQIHVERTKTIPVCRTKIYKVWRNMKSRCFYKKDRSYHDYGERGITIYHEWVNSFSSFYDYVSKLQHYGEDGYSLDRINNDGNYEPDNIRWATAFQQTHNRRKVNYRKDVEK